MSTEDYNKCVDIYSDGVYRFALKILRDKDSAKDIVQESFLRLWEKRSDVLKGKEKSYLFTIAYRLIIDTIRHNKKFTDEEPIKYIKSTYEKIYDNTSEIINSAIRELTMQQQQLILLRDYEGYSYKGIGEISGLTESQVKVYIFKARLILKKKLNNIIG
ncbi:MAG: RNA polymerase sigma factor [Rikenellaceae bacterium]|nr:RNA polymerase sigma factor [Rikenellaceae bacterium]